ncbi:hypothetical protein BDV06DRAFT_219088 [Aspergillus oleicola]
MLLTKDIASYYLRLDQSCIFLPSHSSSEPSPCASGRFCLSISRPTSFKAITARVIGRLKTPRYGLFLPETREEVTFQQRQPLARSRAPDSFTMPAGDYEFLFELPLSDVIFDTIFGPKHEYHTYRVEVVIERWMRRDLVVSEPVRIYRYPRLGRHDLAEAVVSNSTQGLGYHLSIPDTRIQHGSTFPVDCWFVLPKGAALSRLRLRVIEKHELSFPATAAETVKYDTHFITSGATHVIFEKEWHFAPNPQGAPVCGTTTVDEHQISMPVLLPSKAIDCSQSYSSKCIKINHFLVIKAEFKDGSENTVREIAEAIRLHIYMKPDDGNDFFQNHLGMMQCEEGERSPPPFYGKHELDQMIPAPRELSVRVNSNIPFYPSGNVC